jgi:hypothetical protein
VADAGFAEMRTRLKFLPFFFMIFFSGSCVFAGSLPVTAKGADSIGGKKTAEAGSSTGGGVEEKSSIKHIIFGEQKIEGKIRRPQLVLIKADQRPEFPPMVSQPLGKTRNIAALVDPSLIEAPQKGAFQFQGTRIVNPAP